MKKITLKNIKAYLQGNYRYRLYYSKFKWLIRKHIREQIDYRIEIMNPECYKRGTCIGCGCMTTALQMANKQCDGNCYPPMLSKIEWLRFEMRSGVRIEDETWIKRDEYTFNQEERKYILKKKLEYVQSN